MKSILSLLILQPALLFAQETIFYSSGHESRGRDIYALSMDDGKKNKMTNSMGSSHYPHYNNPKLSPDRSTLVFQSDPDGHDRYTIWTMEIDGSNIQKITQNEGLYPNWSPDGKTIVFSGRRNGTWEILTIPASGGTEQIISNNRKNGNQPGWGATCSFHPNGKSMIYSYIKEKVLYSYDFETNETKRLSDKGSYTHPIYSKRGLIAVNRKIGEGYDLVLIEDKKETVIAKSIISYSAPDWYANDSKLLFVGMVNGNQELFTIDIKSAQETQLTKNDTFDAMPVAH
ncbi:hypothetical protein [Ekhidna sp. To15]|uniref:hypothetical protein n=1 Tax=Ekhidna sp. To15 TaxID=3395267 RepID=UPI003F51F3DC